MRLYPGSVEEAQLRISQGIRYPERGEGRADSTQQDRFHAGPAHRKAHDEGLIARTSEAAD